MEYKDILDEAKDREITKEKAVYLLREANNEGRLLELFKTASYVRDKNMGREFKLWPFALSTNKGCSTNPPCRYCGIASPKVKMDTSKDRIASPEEVAKAARIVENLGFEGVQLGGGCSGNKGKEAVRDTEIVKSETDLQVFVNYGYDMSEENIKKLKKLGVNRIGCSLETINEEIFRKIKPGDSLEERKKVANLIDKNGVGLGSGLMIGIGESYEDRVDHIFYLKGFENLNYVYVSGFFPIPGTPMENREPASSIDIAKTLAITKLVHRNIDIGGSFGRDEQLQLWILAGTNLRHVHGMFEPKIKKRGFASRFNGKITEISGRFIFINSLPTYAKMIEEAGLEPLPNTNKR
ncbi:radical SAM protein [Candidatus Aerophobetes bacterium]|nr:radical SAM protein [Candidatus Aerophobetes bacterium]